MSLGPEPGWGGSLGRILFEQGLKDGREEEQRKNIERIATALEKIAIHLEEIIKKQEYGNND